MGGLLKRLAKGLGAGMTSYGQSMMEEKRAKRLETIRSSERTSDKEFRTSEREASQEFQKGESEKDREARLKAKMQNASSLGIKNVEHFKDEFGTDTASYTFTKGEEHFKYDADTDRFMKLGKGAIDKPEVEPVAVDEKDDKSLWQSFRDLFSKDEDAAAAPPADDKPWLKDVVADDGSVDSATTTFNIKDYSDHAQSTVAKILNSTDDVELQKERVVGVIGSKNLPEATREALRALLRTL